VGRGPALLATAIAGFDTAYTFMQPYESVAIGFDDLVRLSVFFMVAMLTSYLQTRRIEAESSLRQTLADLENRVEKRTAELSRSRAQFQTLVTGVTDQAFFNVDSQAAITGWNAGCERMFGFSADDIIGSDVSRLLPECGGTFNVSARRLEQAGEQRLEDQGWAIRKDASRFWASYWVQLIRAEDDPTTPGYVMSVRDLSDRRSLEREVLEVSEQERQRIGHDLHDGLGQELGGISMLATALADKLRDENSDSSTDAQQIASLVRTCISQSRELARGLCPIELEDEGLATGLQQLLDRISRLIGVECAFDHDVDVKSNSLIAVNLYRIVQESITNAIKHGEATQIEVRLMQDGAFYKLTIRDNGHGISANHGESQGLGLRLMNYRAKMIRGTIDITRIDPNGTLVTCRFLEPPTPDNGTNN